MSTPERERRQRGQAGVIADAPLEARRYLAALRRSRWLIVAVVVVVTGAVIAISLSLDKRYTASATVVLDSDTTVLGPPDPVTVQRDLATANSLLTSRRVLATAAARLDGQTVASIDSAVTSAVDPNANLITVSATAATPQESADIANAVAREFLRAQAKLKQARFQAAQAKLRTQLRELQSGGLSSADEVNALRSRISDLGVQQASAGSELALAEAATPPTSPSSPKPFRNAILAFFASLFLAVLVALGREQLRPGVSEPRELGRLYGQTVLASIPMARRGLFERGRHSATSLEAQLYQTLASSLQLLLPASECDLITVTSAIQGEGKTTVVHRLGTALAQAGHKTLLISADLRVPTLHLAMRIPIEPGLSDVMKLVRQAGVSDHLLPAAVRPIPIGEDANGDAEPESTLDVLASGSKVADPASLLSREALTRLFDHIRTSGYRYVLVDAPPILGVADAQSLATVADHTILVARPERLSLENVVEAEELLSRLDVNPLGLVVIGGRSDSSLYYYGGGQRPNILTGPRLRGRS